MWGGGGYLEPKLVVNFRSDGPSFDDAVLIAMPY